MSGAAFHTGKSKQNYATPREFLDAVKACWNIPAFDWDLAANRRNTVASKWLGPDGVRVDSLTTKWSTLPGQLFWLNPPFADIAPWARKCARWQHALRVGDERKRLFLLIPASVGSNWWLDHVHKKGAVKFLSPRLSFDGRNSYPKDCALVIYGFNSITLIHYECWRWKP
jgi:hypothetical protein